MKKALVTLAIAALGAGGVTFAAPLTPGNVVVYRVGDGAAALTTAASPIFLNEYTIAGTLVQTIAVPATGASPLTAAGTAASEGSLNFSPDGLHLAVPGYDAVVGTASIATSPAASAPRSVVLFDRGGAQQSFTTLVSAFDAGNIRSAVTDGTNIWATGSNTGIVTAIPGGNSSTTVSTTPTTLQDVAIFGGQLYVSSSFGTIRMGSVGNGTPITSGQTITALPGFPTNQVINQFFFADLDPSVSGVDTLYVVNQTPSAISKYSLVGGTWTLNNSMTLAGPIGLSGTVSGSNVTMYITATPNALFTLSDTSGYNQNMNGSIQFVAMAATNTAFRGVAVVPTLPPVLYVSSGSQTVDAVSSTGVVTLFATLPANSEPEGLAFDGSGNLYVGDHTSEKISKITPSGAVSLFATMPSFGGPLGLAADTGGNLYAAAPALGEILKITSGGVVSTFSGAGGDRPSGLAFDTNGNLYAGGNLTSGIFQVSPTGTVSTFATLPNGDRAYGLALDTAGNLYAGVRSTNRISKITPAAVVSPFATLPFSSPQGLAFDAAGNLYAADQDSGTISKISPDGLTVTTFATGLNLPTFIAFGTPPPLAPTAVVSRKLHAGVPLDIPLPLPGPGTVGVECRSGGATNNYEVVFTFASSVTFASAAVTAGTGSVSGSSGSGTNTITVDLTGVTNAQKITVTLSGVNNGTFTGDESVQMGVLIGDTTGDGAVNSADVAQAKSKSGQTVDATNFRNDATADGTLNSADISLVKSKSGTGLP